jgi:hypothetical protein
MKAMPESFLIMWSSDDNIFQVVCYLVERW